MAASESTKYSNTAQTKLFLCKFSEEFYFSLTNFEIYHIIFLDFLSTEAATGGVL